MKIKVNEDGYALVNCATSSSRVHRSWLEIAFNEYFLRQNSLTIKKNRFKLVTLLKWEFCILKHELQCRKSYNNASFQPVYKTNNIDRD